MKFSNALSYNLLDAIFFLAFSFVISMTEQCVMFIVYSVVRFEIRLWYKNRESTEFFSSQKKFGNNGICFLLDYAFAIMLSKPIETFLFVVVL